MSFLVHPPNLMGLSFSKGEGIGAAAIAWLDKHQPLWKPHHKRGLKGLFGCGPHMGFVLGTIRPTSKRSARYEGQLVQFEQIDSCLLFFDYRGILVILCFESDLVQVQVWTLFCVCVWDGLSLISSSLFVITCLEIKGI